MPLVLPIIDYPTALRQLPYRGDIVYGPIQSRRIGWSLGINLCPTIAKVCSFDCIYCQFPKLRRHQNWKRESLRLVRTPRLLHLIHAGILKRVREGVHFDSITFAGNGDPSVHPDLPEVARFVRKLIDELDHHVAASIFTNAVPYRDPEFIESLRQFDQRLIKLDASDEETFLAIARPHAHVDLGEMAEALSVLDGLTVQTMVVTGRIDNRASILRPRFGQLVQRMRATEVQLYTIDKRPAYEGVLPVSEYQLHELAESLCSTIRGIPISVYYQDCPSGFPDVVAPKKGARYVPGEPADAK